MTCRVIALDPGGCTGWATYTQTDSVSLPFKGFTSGTLGPEKHGHLLEHLLENQRVSEYHVICERFIPQPDNPGKHDIAGRYQEVVESVCHREGLSLSLQTPSQAKAFVPNAVLRRLDLWLPGRSFVHEMDAYRHLLWYLVNKEKRRDLLEIGWPK